MQRRRNIWCGIAQTEKRNLLFDIDTFFIQSAYYWISILHKFFIWKENNNIKNEYSKCCLYSGLRFDNFYTFHTDARLTYLPYLIVNMQIR